MWVRPRAAGGVVHFVSPGRCAASSFTFVADPARIPRLAAVVIATEQGGGVPPKRK